jgi:hypothetical protein
MKKIEKDTPCATCRYNLGSSYELIIKCGYCQHGVLASSKKCKFKAYKIKL